MEENLKFYLLVSSVIIILILLICINVFKENIKKCICSSNPPEQDTDYNIGNFGDLLPIETVSNHEKSLDNVEDSNADDTMKFASFVTLRPGHSEAPEETEDFTLMLRPSAQNMQFNINELRLPTLEESVINDSCQ
ncbi:uncharacterized protein [Temnothorax longispinosus]|uniref:uncharacterized protein n=1 Tax=Temnothorax longispinosus TaxID=300112 RepID=UPI003A9A4A1E